MASKRVLVTSAGCYAVNNDGVTVELENGQEATVEESQANVFVKVGKAKLVTNEQKKQKQKAD